MNFVLLVYLNLKLTDIKFNYNLQNLDLNYQGFTGISTNK